MKRLIISAGLLLGLAGCATYDYVGGGAGGYYHGSPSVQYSYPYGYPYGRYDGYYGYGNGYYGYGGYGGRYPIYLPPHNHRPPSRPPQHGHGNGHRPRPPHGQDMGPPTPSVPSRPPVNSGGGKSPWRDMDRLQRPQQSRPAAAQPMQRAMPRPQAAAPRPAMQPRPAAPARQPSHNRDRSGNRVEER